MFKPKAFEHLHIFFFSSRGVHGDKLIFKVQCGRQTDATTTSCDNDVGHGFILYLKRVSISNIWMDKSEDGGNLHQEVWCRKEAKKKKGGLLPPLFSCYFLVICTVAKGF
jgi:hypothetical protein